MTRLMLFLPRCAVIQDRQTMFMGGGEAISLPQFLLQVPCSVFPVGFRLPRRRTLMVALHRNYLRTGYRRMRKVRRRFGSLLIPEYRSRLWIHRPTLLLSMTQLK